MRNDKDNEINTLKTKNDTIIHEINQCKLQCDQSKKVESELNEENNTLMQKIEEIMRMNNEQNQQFSEVIKELNTTISNQKKELSE